MASLALSCSPCPSLFINNNKNPHFSIQNTKFTSLLNNNQLNQSSSSYKMKRNQFKSKRNFGVVCYSSPLSPHTLQWVSTISSVVLVLTKGTAIPKSFLVPLFAMQAPRSIISWIKGEYGMWTAFLALLVRLFFFIPGELELPFLALLLVIVSPYQVTDFRGTQVGAITSLIIAGYIAFQHFSRLGSLRQAFDQGSAIATTAVVSITAAACLLLI